MNKRKPTSRFRYLSSARMQAKKMKGSLSKCLQRYKSTKDRVSITSPTQNRADRPGMQPSNPQENIENQQLFPPKRKSTSNRRPKILSRCQPKKGRKTIERRSERQFLDLWSQPSHPASQVSLPLSRSPFGIRKVLDRWMDDGGYINQRTNPNFLAFWSWGFFHISSSLHF